METSVRSNFDFRSAVLDCSSLCSENWVRQIFNFKLIYFSSGLNSLTLILVMLCLNFNVNSVKLHLLWRYKNSITTLVGYVAINIFQNFNYRLNASLWLSFSTKTPTKGSSRIDLNLKNADNWNSRFQISWYIRQNEKHLIKNETFSIQKQK